MNLFHVFSTFLLLIYFWCVGVWVMACPVHMWRSEVRGQNVQESVLPFRGLDSGWPACVVKTFACCHVLCANFCLKDQFHSSWSPFNRELLGVTG